MKKEKITKAQIRMFRVGTGDCFIIQFYGGEEPVFNMMIDAGTWFGDKKKLLPYVKELRDYTQGHIHLLVITHEHKDHVSIFGVCRDYFEKEIKVDKIWMSWTENDGQKKVKKWKDDYGNKKKALSLAAEKLATAINSTEYKDRFRYEFNGKKILEGRKKYLDIVNNFRDLHLEPDDSGSYMGGLAGMKFVKDKIAQNNIEYLSPGDIVSNLRQLPGVKFYVLGPPLLYEQVKQESGKDGETYAHNKDLGSGEYFASAVLGNDTAKLSSLLPFDDKYEASPMDEVVVNYKKTANQWRKIDDDWLFGAGNFALRMNSLTNNLSLALAIEFEESGKVMLFPGDAEYGSWASWHGIPWKQKGKDGKKSLTEDLLSRTVFYKVAHHLSHNGTARKLGLDMMTNEHLVSMATLDYNVISPSWKNTMPNKALIEQLIRQTRGRLIVMNEEDVYFSKEDRIFLKDKIKEGRSRMSSAESDFFDNNYESHPLYHQFTLTGCDTPDPFVTRKQDDAF